MKRRDFILNMGILSALTFMPKHFFTSTKKKFKTNHEKCKEAWTKLCRKHADKPPFKYIEQKKDLPNVLLYGDSISIGYTPTVRKELEGKANVYRLHRNGASSNQFITYMEELKHAMFQPHFKEGWDFTWDLIHFNVGLHDLKYVVEGSKLDKVNGKQMSSLTKYKNNLKAICNYLQKEFPNTKLVFATTTPVPEGEPGRFAGDEIKYNKAALDVLKHFPNIMLNDLHSFVLPSFKEWAIKPGNVHYNNNGKQKQGVEVANKIFALI